MIPFEKMFITFCFTGKVETDLTSVDSLPKCLCQLELSQAREEAGRDPHP